MVDQSGGEPVDCSPQWHGAYKLRELSTNMARLYLQERYRVELHTAPMIANFVSCFPGNPDVAPAAFKLIPGY